MLNTGVKPEGFVQLNNNIKSLKKKVKGLFIVDLIYPASLQALIHSNN